MEQKIEHSFPVIGGLRLHVAHVGEGELGTAVFLHGFPEIWYSWRHQMIAVANAGFKSIAPDFRGYGLSDEPPEPENASYDQLDADLLAIFDTFFITKAFIVAKDFGVMVAKNFILNHPDRVMGVVTLGVPLAPGAFSAAVMPEGFYIMRWREPGRAEADFGRFDVKTVVKNVYILFSRSKFPEAKKDQEIMDLVDSSTPLPSWFSEEDLVEYAKLYEKNGFRYPLQMPYKALMKEPSTAELKVRVPAMLIMGEEDYILEWPNMQEYIRSEAMKNFVPNLDAVFIPEGSHFIQEQFPDQVNQLIIAFLKNHFKST